MGTSGRPRPELSIASRPDRVLPLAVLAVAAALAVWSLGFGLPYLFRPDEDVMVGRSVHMAVDGSLDPLLYNYPPLAFYLFASAERVMGLLPGGHLGPADQVDPTGAYLAARAVSAAAFVASAALVYLAGRHLYGRAGGLLAAACLAVSPLAVRQAHFATTDGIAMALVAAAILVGLRAQSRRGYLLAGAIAGLAGLTKYTSGAVVVFLAVLALGERDRWGRLAAAAGGALAVLAVVAVVAGHPREYLDGLRFLSARAGQTYQGLAVGFIYHPTRSLPLGLGFGAYALCIGGVVLAAARRRRPEVALLAYLLVYFVLIGYTHEVFFRYVMPMLPALCVLAGGLVRLVPKTLPGRALAVAGAVLMLAPSAYASISGDVLLGRTDTRRQAADWLAANAPAGSEIRVANYWVQPFYDRRQFTDRPLNPIYVTGNHVADSYQQGRYTDRFAMNRPGAPGTPCYTLLFSGPPQQSPDPAAAGDAQTVFRPYSGTAPDGAVYDPIDSYFVPIWGFGGLERPGPTLAVVQGCG